MALRAPPFVTAEVRDFVHLVEQAWAHAGYPSVTLTSWWRTRYQNALVGGHPSSQHLTGLAIDLLSDVPGDRFASAARLVGLVPVDEGDHWHVQRFAASAARGLCCGLAVAQVR